MGDRSRPLARVAALGASLVVVLVTLGATWAVAVRTETGRVPERLAGSSEPVRSPSGGASRPSGASASTASDPASRGSRRERLPPPPSLGRLAPAPPPSPAAPTSARPDTPSAQPTPSPDPATATPSASPVAAAEAEVVRLANAERAKAGCAPLRVDSRLTAAAEAHSRDMVDRDYFSHTSPDGEGPGDRAAAAGYPNWSGENIAEGYPTAEAVMRGWMSSSGHRANILNCDSKATGVGYDPRKNVWTQMFGYV